MSIGESSAFGFAMTLTDPAVDRDAVVRRLAVAGVETRPIVAGDFTAQPVMAWLPHEPTPVLPNAQAVQARGFYIGNPPQDLGDRLDRLRDLIVQALRPS